MVITKEQISPSSAPLLPVLSDLPLMYSHHHDAVHLGSSQNQAKAGTVPLDLQTVSYIHSSFPYKLPSLKYYITVIENGQRNIIFLK